MMYQQWKSNKYSENLLFLYFYHNVLLTNNMYKIFFAKTTELIEF
jgi:hypothetical protein